MNMREKTAYIKGLLEGLDLDASKPEGKLIKALVDAVDEMAAELEELKQDVEDYGEYIEEIDEDLGFLEDIVYDLDDEDDEYDCDGNCDECDDEECDLREGGFRCALCPNCGEKIYFDESTDPDEVVCPSCKKPLFGDEEEEKE